MSTISREGEESEDIEDYKQWRADKKLTNSPLSNFEKTTDYRFSRLKVDLQDMNLDQDLKR